MIAAIYARKSTEQTGVSDEEKSVTRQIEHAKAYAGKKGWRVCEEHIYVDDGISGAEFVKRPGLARLMNALKPTPAFQALIMSEESRLGREQIETAYLLKQILDAGVRVLFYLEDREGVLDSALDKVMLSLTSFASEVEREKARQRTYDAMLRKAKALHVTGGKVYGYDNIAVTSPTPGPDGQARRLYVIRRINPEQAAVVRRIFELCARGKGLTRIAKALNAEGVPPPRHARGWAPTAIREILYRPLYRGEIVWNKLKKIIRGGTKKRIRRPPAEWVHCAAPALRIIPADLWQAAHARLDQARHVFARALARRQCLGQPPQLDLESPFLLSGMARCAVCGGAIIAMSRLRGTQREHRYGCSYHHKRGTTICANGVQIRQDLLDHAVLQSICELLDRRIVEAAVSKALARLRADYEGELGRRAAIERELSHLEAREQHLVEAIKQGEAMEPLVAALKAEEERKKALVAELDGLADRAKVPSLDSARLKRNLMARVADLQSLLTRHTPQARQMLRKLLMGRLTLTPYEEAGSSWYRFEGQGTYGWLLAGESLTTSNGVPSGIRTRVIGLKGRCPRPG
jgi:site-specific DNA recombinase